MAVLLTAPASTGTSGYSLLIADDRSQVEAAQRLRHDVFAGELGAHLPGAVDGRDVDGFDDFCNHLIVRDDATAAVSRGAAMMWQPVSGCGADCRAAGGLRVGHGRPLLRVVTLCAVLMMGLIVVPLTGGAALRTLARAVLAA